MPRAARPVGRGYDAADGINGYGIPPMAAGFRWGRGLRHGQAVLRHLQMNLW